MTGPADGVSHRSVLLTAAVGLWSATLSVGALRVILPVYFASIGMEIAKIALLFVFFKAAQMAAPLGMGLTINRIGYRKGFISGLWIHSLLSLFFLIKPALSFIYFERFVRGLITMPLLGEVYIKRFSSHHQLGTHINILLGLRDVAKGAGMLIGGVLIGMMPLEYSLAAISLLTTAAALLAYRYLPDVREKIQSAPHHLWTRVGGRIKTLAVSRGFLHGSEEAWTMVILPVYLSTLFGLSPASVGAIMMSLLFFQGGAVFILSKIANFNADYRKVMGLCALMLVPVCLLLAGTSGLFLFLAFALLYYFFTSYSAIYHNTMKLRWSDPEKSSVELAAFKFLSHLPIPIAIGVSGILAERFGFSSAFYFAGLLALGSALTCLALPKVHEKNPQTYAAERGPEEESEQAK